MTTLTRAQNLPSGTASMSSGSAFVRPRTEAVSFNIKNHLASYTICSRGWPNGEEGFRSGKMFAHRLLAAGFHQARTARPGDCSQGVRASEGVVRGAAGGAAMSIRSKSADFRSKFSSSQSKRADSWSKLANSESKPSDFRSKFAGSGSKLSFSGQEILRFWEGRVPQKL